MIKIPKTFMGKPVEGAMKKVLEGTPTNPSNNNSNPTSQNANSSPINLRSPEDYILLPGVTHGNFAYADTLVSMYKLGMSPEVEQAGQQLDYQFRNPNKESNGRDYIGNINWQQALKLNLTLSGMTLNPRMFADFLLLLKSGNAVDGNGQRVAESKLVEILDEITKVRSPYRAEWLDANFKYLNGQGNSTISDDTSGQLWIYTNHQFISGNLNPFKHKLENCLMTKGSRINLSTMNSQGMPIEEGNDFLYWCPDKDNNSVARFGAGSDRASLDCNRYPTSAYASLGVRYCVPKARAQNF